MDVPRRFAEDADVTDLARLRIVRYVTALGTVALATGLTNFLWPDIRPAVSSPFLAAIMVSAWLGGLGPGLLASALSALAIEYFFSPPYHAIVLDVGDTARITAFLAVALLISSLSARRKTAERRLQEANRQLEGRVAERTAELSKAKDALEAEVEERRRTEERLRRSEASYRSLIQGATYGIYRVGMKGEFLEVNPALVAMLGYESEAELLGVNLDRDIYRDPEDRTRLIEAYRQRGRIEGVEVEWKRKDGTPITIRLSGRAVQDEGGTLASLEVIAEDVTERRSLEAQFREAQKMEAVGRLAGGIAHDFRNLLTVIAGRAEFLLRDLGSDGRGRAHVDLILESAWRAEGLIQRLLAFSRKQVLQRKVLDLNALVANMATLLRRMIGEDIELVFAPGVDLGRVHADPAQLEQALMNLAVNARDAMPSGGRLTIETRNVEVDDGLARLHPAGRPGPQVALVVRDTGVGMDAETRSRIFEPFFTTKEPGRGTGLGLSSVYGIVTQHGGCVAVESEPGSGATFTILLPRVEGAEGLVEPAATLPGPVGGSETVLLVEDEEEVRGLVGEVLSRYGYTVLAARDGHEALLIGQQHPAPIHLLVTDVVMPRLSGPDLAERLASLHPETSILYVSGYGDIPALRRGGSGQAPAFLAKPFSVDALAQKVREVLDRRPPIPS